MAVNLTRRILHHGSKSLDALVLTHGLTDSPYYMEAIAHWFYQAGANVVLALLPGHGLKDPDKALEDGRLNERWCHELDQAVAEASRLGDRVSLGGFSTGGTLSLIKLLRDPEAISGALFLFSAALRIGRLGELAGQPPFTQIIAKLRDGKFEGIGPNPYKYPVMSDFAGIELTDIIEDSDQCLKGSQLRRPIFSAYSAHDKGIEPLEAFRQAADRILGDTGWPWYVSYRVRVGVK